MMPKYIETPMRIYRDGELIETRTVQVPETAEQIEADVYRASLATEFAAFKVAIDALTALPNSTLGGGAREIKDFARATRRMMRAAIRELKAIDTAETP